MSIFDYLKGLGNKAELTEEEAEALRVETENKIRSATKQQLRDFEERICLMFHEVETFAEMKMHEIKVILTKEPATKWEELSHREREIDEYLKRITTELENETEKMIDDTIKGLKLDPGLIRKRFDNIRTVLKATAGMGMRKNREFFDAIKLITKKNGNG